MLEIRKTSLTLEEAELLELERITTDLDADEALSFLRRVIYLRAEKAQKGKLQSHLDGCAGPVEGFKKENL